MHLENIPLTLHPPPRPTAQLAMRHERIPIEQKLSNDVQCRPATPAFEGALMGTARSSGNGKTGTTAGFDSNSPGAHGHHGGNDMDWLMGAGNLDDPLSSLMVSHQPPSSSPSSSPPPSRSRIQRRGARDAPAPADQPPHETRKPESVRNARTSHHSSTFLIPPTHLTSPTRPSMYRRSSRKVTAPEATSTSAMTSSACPPPTPAAWNPTTLARTTTMAPTSTSSLNHSTRVPNRAKATGTRTPATHRRTGRITRRAGRRIRARAPT